MRNDRRLKALKTIVIFFIYLLEGCSPAIQSNSSSNYSEDISSLRPKYELPVKDSVAEDSTTKQIAFNPQYDITDTLSAVLDSISVLSKEKIKYVDGYAIQLYSGSNREMASITKGKVYKLLEDEEPSLFYKAPNFKVHVGQYYSSLDAHKTLALVKTEFPNAILVLKKFKIERD